MKNLYKSLLVIAAAALTTVSCQKNELPIEKAEGGIVNFNASVLETKTVFGTPSGNSYPTLWTEEDSKVGIALAGATNFKSADVIAAADGKSASFVYTIDEEKDSAPFQFQIVSPSTASLGISADKGINIYFATSQTPSATSVDPAAQVLYAQSDVFDEAPASVDIHFSHVSAYGKLTITGLDANAKISSVSLTAEEDWAGRWYYKVADGSFTANSASKTIDIVTSSAEDIWFACAPVDLGGKSLKLTVVTDKGNYVKTVTIPSGKKFEAGKIAKFNVSMSGVTPVAAKEFVLVTSASQLVPGSEVIIAAQKADYAIGTTQNGNNRAAVAITKNGDKLTAPSESVQIFTLEEGSKTGTYAFNAGNGYIYAASSDSNWLRTQDAADDNASFAIALNEGAALITAQGTYTHNTINYNSGSTLFSCYAADKPLTNGETAIYVSTEEVKPTLSKPTLVATIENDPTSYITIKLSWSNIDANANGIYVYLDGKKLEANYINANGTIIGYQAEDTEYKVKIEVTAEGYNSAFSDEYALIYKSGPTTSIANTLETAYTVAQARALVDAGKDLDTEVYVTGIVKSASFYQSSGTYNVFITDPNGTDEFEFYKFYEGANDTKFTEDYIKPDDSVTGYGKLTKYGTTYEFTAGCYLAAYEKGEGVTVPTFDSLASLIAAGVASNTTVTVTLKDEEITGFYTSSSGSKKGVYLEVSDQTIEIYGKNATVPDSWKEGGTISGTVTCSWEYFERDNIWELCPSNFDDFTYKAPAGPVAATISFSPAAVSVYENASATVTVTTDYDGTISVASANSSVATATISGKTITVKGVSAGTTTINVTGAATASYKAISTSINVTVSKQTSGSAKFVKVTSASDLKDGKYLIVYETDKIAFDGSLSKLDAAHNVVNVTIVSNEIAATDALIASTFTIATMSGGYSIMSASGKYISGKSDKNALNEGTAASANTISFDSGNAVITSNSSTLQFNATAGDSNYRFRYYYKAGQKAIQLYKLSD